MTPLGERLAARIRAAGPMTVADYMAACLGDAEHGYYMRREPFGPEGDFVTAPEVSQMFGELIGLWCVAVWQGLGAPGRFVLAELGPGRGTLMADLLRAAAVRPAFGAAAAVRFVETSPRLRAIQEATLAGAAPDIGWCSAVDELPPGPLIVVANEFFDALPVRQFVRTADGWAERLVGLDEAGRLAFGLGPPVALPPGVAGAVAAGTIAERRPAAEAIAETLARRIAADGGAALVIDYGHVRSGFGDTLQAVRGHAPDDPLAHPGEADLTAHVDFAALAAAAGRGGAVAPPVTTQGEWLARLGLAARAATLSAGKPAEVRAAVTAAAERLAGPEAMGTLFKVLAFGSPGLALPGFDPPA